MREKDVTWMVNPRFKKVSLEWTGSTYVPGRLTFDPPAVPTVNISRHEILQAVEEDKAKRLLLPYVEEKLQEAGLEMTEEAKACFVNTLFLIMKKVSQTIKEAEV